jgi:hypothetical protein
MVRYQAERELTEQLRAVIWGGSAGGGEHHALHAEPQAEPSSSLPALDHAVPAIPNALVLALIGLLFKTGKPPCTSLPFAGILRWCRRCWTTAPTSQRRPR